MRYLLLSLLLLAGCQSKYVHTAKPITSIERGDSLFVVYDESIVERGFIKSRLVWCDTTIDCFGPERIDTAVVCSSKGDTLFIRTSSTGRIGKSGTLTYQQIREIVERDHFNENVSITF